MLIRLDRREPATVDEPGAQVASLLRQHAGRLPLEAFCMQGGWPDDTTLELTLLSVDQAPDGIRARVEVRFNERISTGCSTSRNNTNAGGELKVHWAPASGACIIEVADRLA